MYKKIIFRLNNLKVLLKMKKTTFYKQIACYLFLFLPTLILAQNNLKLQSISKTSNNKSNTLKTKKLSKTESLEFILNLLKSGEDKDFITTSEHVSSISNINHKYIRQAINGIEVMGTESSVHHDQNGKLVKSNIKFVKNIEKLVKTKSTNLSPEQAITIISQKMGYGTPVNLRQTKKENASYVTTTDYQKKTSYYTKANISSDLIPFKKLYFYNELDSVYIAYEFSIKDINSSDWYNFTVDANTGEILNKYNLMLSCNIIGEHTHDNHKKKNSNILGDLVDQPQPEVVNPALVGGGSYNVYPMPIESPGHGNRSIINDPANAVASPYGWHDVNGAAGAEYTYTRGNNTEAYDDDNGTNAASNQNDYAEGGASLIFDFPVNTTYTNGNQSEDAAVTNTFFWANIIHDVTYLYGFDEASGNFQENNYGNGGAGGDGVNSEIQDGSGTCNANFGTPADGQNPRMQMFVCNTRDGDFDNVVIVHEYTHGISTRLTGGAANSGCLQGNEQMGEGWGDFLGLMMTIEPGDQGTDQRGIGTWLVGQGPNGPGIRPQPYSTTNTQTYADIGTAAVPHGVGSVWSSILWKLNWALIGVHGYDADIYNGTGGNNICLALVMEGMKLQGCNPGFVDGRDAILAADQAMNGGANADTIWQVFADAGLGVNADQGSSNSNTDGTTDNTVPPPATPTVTFANPTSSQLEGSNCDFTDIIIPVNIGVGPSTNTVANFTINSGTANASDYQLINNSVTFSQGATAAQNITLRVFNDNFVEGDENLEITFTINNNNGDANTGNTSHIVTIFDDDIITTATQNLNIYSENFDPLVNNINSEDLDGDGNEWNLSDEITLGENNNTIGFDGQFAVSRSWIPDNGGTALSPNNVLMSADPINIPANATSATLSFVSGTVQVAPWDKETYSVYISTSSDPNTIISTASLLDETLDYPNGGFSTRTVNLTPYIGQNIYYAFRHYNTNDMNTLIIDDISIDIVKNTEVQTTINESISNAIINLPSNGIVYGTDTVSNNAILDITNNNTFNYGCLDISVNREGNSTQSYNGSTGNNLVIDKTFKITSTNTATNEDTTIDFYLTASEMNGFTSTTGLTSNDLYAYREGSGDVVALTTSVFGSNYKLSGDFTGLNGTYYLGAEGAFKTTISPRVYLSGPTFSGGLMADGLRSGGYIPTTSPYADSKTCNASVFNTTGNDAIVDWVWVELRDATTNSTISASTSALLQRDGDIVDVDGTSPLTITATSKDYYVVINHRNHLGAMSNAVVTLSMTPTVVDFTNGLATFGTNAQKDIGSGTMGLWAGDTSGNGQIRFLGPGNDTNSLKSTITNDSSNTSGSLSFPVNGYTNADINLNGQARFLGPGNDTNVLKNTILANPSNTGNSLSFPITQQLP